MSSPNSASQGSVAGFEDEVPEYRPVSTLAVGGLLLGLSSVLAFVHPLLWLLPLAGALASGWALVRLCSAEALQIGRKAALVGLTLSLVLGASAPVRWGMFRWQLRCEARLMSRQWFEALREGDPYRAHQLTWLKSQRFPPDDDLVARYAEPAKRRDIEEYVQEPHVRALLSLGKYATVRYFENKSLDAAPEQSTVVDVYAVSVEDQGQTTSFFVRMVWVRAFDHGGQDWQWRLSHSDFMHEFPPGWNPPA